MIPPAARKALTGLTLAVGICIAGVTPVPAQQSDSLPAFPGAEGFGMYTAGGRGGRVIRVTNLNTSGPGSLQEACNTPGPRIVVFDTSGVIPGQVGIPHGQITILGQTAPAPGITLRGMLYTPWDPTGQARYSDIVIRFLRIRPDPIPGVTWADAIQFSGVRRCVLDHISCSWASDETVDIFSSAEMTVQWCAIEESDITGHPEGMHGYGMINGPEGGWVSVHHNLFAHHSRRSPAISNGPSDIRNNVVYNFKDGFLHDNQPNDKGYNIIGNYYKTGPDWSSPYPFCFWGTTSYYLRDNYMHGRGAGYTGMIQDPWAEAAKMPGLLAYANQGRMAGAETPVPPVTTHSPQEAFELVLEQAGCFPRDSVSRRTVNEVRTTTGLWGRRDPGNLLAGMPVGTREVDSDGDGMPDWWERSRGLNPADSADHARVMPSGYTAIEEYANLLAERLIMHRGEPPKRGDIDGNGRTDIFDLLGLLRVLAGGEGGGALTAADVNLDRKTDIFDLLEMLRLLGGK